jgi:hypothetical protein
VLPFVSPFHLLRLNAGSFIVRQAFAAKPPIPKIEINRFSQTVSRRYFKNGELLALSIRLYPHSSPRHLFRCRFYLSFFLLAPDRSFLLWMTRAQGLYQMLPRIQVTRQIVNVEETLLTSIGYRRLPDERVKTCQHFGYDGELSVRDSHVTRDDASPIVPLNATAVFPALSRFRANNCGVNLSNGTSHTSACSSQSDSFSATSQTT